MPQAMPGEVFYLGTLNGWLKPIARPLKRLALFVDEDCETALRTLPSFLKRRIGSSVQPSPNASLKWAALSEAKSRQS